MTPVLTNGTRGLATSVDYAALRDIGWQVTTIPAPSLQFNAISYTTTEAAGAAVVTVARTGGLGQRRSGTPPPMGPPSPARTIPPPRAR